MHPIRIGMVGLGIMGRRYYCLLQDLGGGSVGNGWSAVKGTRTAGRI